jgi:hypothetical protein
MNTKTSKQLSADEKKEVEALKARLAELESVPASQPQEEQSTKEAKRDKVLLDDYVPVMSLLPFKLNLSTKEGGQGDIKKFTRFGEVKNILYKDLVDIIEVDRTFMEAGYFYILDPVVIRQHGLDEVYSKILTKEKIEEILNNVNTEYCIDLYNSANPEQQRVIVQLFIEKMKKDPESVNLYTVDRISALSKIQISQVAKESKELQEELAEQGQQQQ